MIPAIGHPLEVERAGLCKTGLRQSKSESSADLSSFVGMAQATGPFMMPEHVSEV